MWVARFKGQKLSKSVQWGWERSVLLDEVWAGGICPHADCASRWSFLYSQSIQRGWVFAAREYGGITAEGGISKWAGLWIQLAFREQWQCVGAAFLHHCSSLHSEYRGWCRQRNDRASCEFTKFSAILSCCDSTHEMWSAGGDGLPVW